MLHDRSCMNKGVLRILPAIDRRKFLKDKLPKMPI